MSKFSIKAFSATKTLRHLLDRLISPRLFFDKRDHELIKIVNDLYDSPHSLGYTRKLYYPFFHPLGIKELSESKGLRIAYSVVHLLNSLERGDEENRIQALRGLRDEIIDTRTGPMPLNSARVLLQLMKELVRARGHYSRQLELAHDFRKTASGKPSLICRQLEKYHLLEMPEEWNQATFDDHVHDANTKGRKTPTHLIMDAWIKGIRRLRVVYYQYLEPRFVAELSEAADIMGVDIRIGIEFSARYRDRFVSLIWVSRGFMDVQSFLCFLAEPHVIEFMDKGREVMKYQEKYVLRVLDEFNSRHRERFTAETGLTLPSLDPGKFLAFVSPGQPSILHLGEYIHHMCVKYSVDKLSELSNSHGKLKGEILENLTTVKIVSSYLSPEHYPHIHCPWKPCDGPDVPERLNLPVEQLLAQIAQIHYSFKITLNLTNLKVEDVLELLYAGNGLISRLEIFNLKDYAAGHHEHIPPINELQQAINDGSLIRLKRVVRHVIHRMEKGGYSDEEDRRENLVAILHDLATFKNMYKGVPLKSRMGSDSTGRSLLAYGMGLGIIDSLPLRARREIRKHASSRLILPVHVKTYPSVTSIPVSHASGVSARLLDLLSALPGLEYLGAQKVKKWIVEEYSTTMEESGNIVTLGGGQQQMKQELALSLSLPLHEKKDKPPRKSWANLNTGVRNALKVIIGFIPAFATFALTKEWWVLAYFGAFIWFGITGLRNIVQAVLGGGGIIRSPLLRWNDYVSWERITDSLLFTGFSVPLLDYLIKTLLLDHGLGITISTNPAALYAIMATANGIYLASHNAFRGFPRAAIIGNLFRSLFSIPIAVLFSAMTGGILSGMGVAGVEDILQKWAAVISKAASDLVAALIEGPADRFQNIALRTRDYKRKFTALFDAYSRLELIFPDAGELSLFENPEKLLNSPNAEVRDLMTVIIINSLDMLYFWMYQPRARTTLKEMMGRFTPEERRIYLLSQKILEQEQHVSRLFVDGILGRRFSGPLSFYLMRYEQYLTDLKNI
ncbi:conserved membrane hypothetical protein [Desulfamplus magnetovallimortis]|uniref:Uncharacterized protein n=1 Tax=Desulfamplus magnetovallimortis TaxID=1246637 RepID=A0A1W1HHH1_9BACT|nr:hypothetical protein [Desulfamplus magnetovallimortis]SLM31951.1 conserved membrane hypothetical protein [Desulfamplus magnetovallimortis]